MLNLENSNIGGRIINVRFPDDATIISKTQEELQDMVDRLVETGRKYGILLNFFKKAKTFLVLKFSFFINYIIQT